MKNILLIIAVFFIFTACINKQEKSDNFLNIALTSQIPTLDHANSYDTVSAEVIYQIHEPLYEYEYLIRPYTLKPLVADSLPIISNNGKTYRFKIKKNIFFHSHEAFKGKRELKAEDFINQIKRIAFDKKSNGYWLFKNVVGIKKYREEIKNIDEIFTKDISGIKKINDYEFEINLNSSQPQFIYAFAMAFTAPAPEELIKFYKNDLSIHPVGTGPFKFIRWDRSLVVVLHKFNNYHESYYPKKGDRYSYENNLLQDKGEKVPFIDGIKFHIIKEAQTRWLNFLSKKVDFIILTKDHFTVALDPNGNLKEEYLTKKIDLQISPTLTYWWLAFNMQDEIVGGNNKLLRQAIAHAIDFNKYIEIFTNNIGQRANSIYPPGIPGYNPSAELPYEYNLEKAKELLKKAGYPDGKGLPELNFDIRGVSNVSRQGGEFIQRELEKIGIKVNIVVNTFAAFLKKAQNKKLQFWQGGWAMDYPDAENIVQLLTKASLPPGPNSTNYVHPLVEELYQKLLTKRLTSR
jgi:oligopeptide transport system substrate-binding protein